MGQMATGLREEQHGVGEGWHLGTWQSRQCTRKGTVQECAPCVRAEWAMWRELRRKWGASETEVGASLELFILVFVQHLFRAPVPE